MRMTAATPFLIKRETTAASRRRIGPARRERSGSHPFHDNLVSQLFTRDVLPTIPASLTPPIGRYWLRGILRCEERHAAAGRLRRRRVSSKQKHLTDHFDQDKFARFTSCFPSTWSKIRDIDAGAPVAGATRVAP